jgi:P4 family phage/plasmid primase-like protien
MTLPTGASGGGWSTVTSDRPCPVCGKHDWCSRNSEGDVVCCRRNIEFGSQLDKAFTCRTGKIDKAGLVISIWRTHPPGTWAPPRYTLADGKGECAPAEILDCVYRNFRNGLSLTDEHRANLRSRGLSDEEIMRRGYRSLGTGRAKATYELVKFGLEKHLPQVPGFFVQTREDGGKYWTVGGKGGILIPVNNREGKITALMVRGDGGKAGKYHYLSSKKRGGPGPGIPVHFPLYEGGDTSVVGVTEGVLKADIATARSGLRYLGLPGVSGWRRAAKALGELGAKIARIAFDADASTKPTVAHALDRLARDLREHGFEVELEVWDPADGKGIDDLRAAGKEPIVLRGDAVFAEIEAIVKAAAGTSTAATDPEGAPASKPGDPHRLAGVFLRDHAHPDRPTLAFYRDEWWRWRQGRWRTVPLKDMQAILSRSIKREFDLICGALTATWLAAGATGEPPSSQAVTSALVNNTLLALTSRVLVANEVEQPAWLLTEEEAERRNYLALANGLLDLDACLAGRPMAEVLRPASPRWFSPVYLPYAFDPAARCPRWEKFLQRNLEGDDERIRLLQEWLGYCLLIDTDLQRFLLLEGEGRNGKSVYCAGIAAVLGLRNVSHVPLEAFNQRFALTQTLGKLANIASEVGELDRPAEGILKSFTSGDRMMFDRKCISPVEAMPTARLVLATNNRPRFGDRSDGLWRRMLFVPFRVTIPESERIQGMDKPSWWQASGELPGMLNWALAGLHLLRVAGRFTEPTICREAVEQYKLESNPARLFLRETCRVQPDALVPKDKLYQAYQRWCRANGCQPLAFTSFSSCKADWAMNQAPMR